MFTNEHLRFLTGFGVRVDLGAFSEPFVRFHDVTRMKAHNAEIEMGGPCLGGTDPHTILGTMDGILLIALGAAGAF